MLDGTDRAGEPTEPTRTEAETNRSRALTAAFVLAGCALLALRLWFGVGTLAVSVPYWDQWDFLDPLFEERGPLDQFLWQHGPHRQGLGGLAYGVLHPATRWSARAEAFVAWAAIAVAAALALRLKLRLAGRLDPADLFVGLAVLTVGSSSLFVGAQNLAHGPIPILLVIAAAALARSPVRGRALAALTLVGALATFTGFALLLVPPLAVLFALEAVVRLRGREPLGGIAAALAALVLSGALFLVDYRWLPASDCLEDESVGLGEAASFLGAMSGRAWGVYGDRVLPTARLALGVALFLLVAAGAVRSAIALRRAGEPDAGRWRAILLLCGFTAGFASMTVAGRACLGVEAAIASRYVLYAAPGMLGVYLWADRLQGRRRWVVLGLLVAILTVREARSGGDLVAAHDLSKRKAAWVRCYLRLGEIDRCDRRANLRIYPPDRRASSRLEQKLGFLEARELSLFADPPAEPPPAKGGERRKRARGG